MPPTVVPTATGRNKIAFYLTFFLAPSHRLTSSPTPREVEIMPLYEYECTACHRRTEKIQKFSDPELTTCPFCQGVLERTLTAPAIQFKGSGWYKDLYSSPRPPSAKGGEGAAAASGDSAGGGSNDSGGSKEASGTSGTSSGNEGGNSSKSGDTPAAPKSTPATTAPASSGS